VDEQIPEKLCGRPLSVADLEVIREQIRLAEPANRAEIARRVCRALRWTNALGEPKLMSARVGLLRLHRAGLIELPAPRCGNGNGRGLKYPPAQWPQALPLQGRVDALSDVRLSAVRDKAASRLWNGLIDRYHYLGYSPLPGRIFQTPLRRFLFGISKLGQESKMAYCLHRKPLKNRAG
jgi:hypothetical protein